MADFDLLIHGGTLIDGSGAPAKAGDLAIADGKIARIAGADSVSPKQARRIIEADGRMVSPGFIDAHTHDDMAVLKMPDMFPKVSQGVTSVVVGNCGISAAPIRLTEAPKPPLNLLGAQPDFVFERFADYAAAVEQARPAVNVAALIGHGTLRVRTMTDLDRRATPSEIAEMRRLLAQSLEEGAIGFSTGLFYDINSGADAGEVAALAELAQARGIYATHLRDEFSGVADSLTEAFETSRRAQVPLIISHHKCAMPENWGRSRETLSMIAQAAQRQPVRLDAYPYTAGSTILDPAKLRGDVRTLVTWSTPHPEVGGRDLAEIAREWGCSTVEAAQQLLPAGAIYFQMDEADVRAILSFPLTMIGSDGLPHDSHPHPRLWGTFPRVLGHYARDLGLFPLEEAVRKMTGLTASTFGLTGRGLLREGYAADVVVFDAARVRDLATYEKPSVPADGIECVIVNGVVSWLAGTKEIACAGQVLRSVKKRGGHVRR
jgi:N-acyl-D-aspartate/D-glutamate deacylase